MAETDNYENMQEEQCAGNKPDKIISIAEEITCTSTQKYAITSDRLQKTMAYTAPSLKEASLQY